MRHAADEVYGRVGADGPEQDLAAIWLAAVDPDAVTQAAARLEEALKFDPLRLGESRESSVRRFTNYQMLSIMFEVIEDDKKVLVHGVFASN